MKKRTLMLLAGAPGTGKTYTSNIITQQYPQFINVPLDLFKEHVYDEIGFDNAEQKRVLDEEARQRFYQGLDTMMSWHWNILGDYPFSYKQGPYLEKLAKKHNYQVITIRLEAPIDVLYTRQRSRDKDEPRHLGHMMSHYHRGDFVDSRDDFDGLPSFEVFEKRVQDRGYTKFKLGQLIRVDVSDYTKINYPKLLEQIDSQLNGNC
jgi:tRNA uridine 5-carbamoylmethylation protein Kti12